MGTFEEVEGSSACVGEAKPVEKLDCTVLVVIGCLLTSGLYVGVSSIRQWSQLPRGGMAVALYGSLTFNIQKVQGLILFSVADYILCKVDEGL